MAVRRESLIRSGHEFFKPPVEDVEFQTHLLKKDMRGSYIPQLIVYHKISPGRLTPGYFYHWYYLRGTLLDLEEKYQPRFFQPFGVSWKLILKTVKLFIRSIITTSTTNRIYRRSHAFFILGQMKQIATRNS
jgi:GT2 family glycosyltransferase